MMDRSDHQIAQRRRLRARRSGGLRWELAVRLAQRGAALHVTGWNAPLT